MDLLSLLVEEFSEWPSIKGIECEFIVQEFDCELYATFDCAPVYRGGEAWYPGDAEGRDGEYFSPRKRTAHLADDWMSAIITKDAWEAARSSKVPTTADACPCEPVATLTTALGDCVSVMGRELSGLAVIQPELKAAREALAAAGAHATAWTGEGLPPVGTVCEWLQGSGHEWERIEILAYHGRDAWIQQEGQPSTIVGNIGNLRPLRTPEQIAAEEREKAAKQLCVDAGSPEQTAAQMAVAYRLLDAGYRKDPRTADLLRALKDIATSGEESTVLGLKTVAALALAAVEGGAQ